MEIKCTQSPAYAARAPRSSSPGITFHRNRLKCFARKATGFTGFLFYGWGAPTSRDQWPKGGSWVTGGGGNWTPQLKKCTDKEGNARDISTKFHSYSVEFVFQGKKSPLGSPGAVCGRGEQGQGETTEPV